LWLQSLQIYPLCDCKDTTFFPFAKKNDAILPEFLCGFPATSPPLVCGLCSSPFYLRLFFDSSPFLKRRTIEEQTKNNQGTTQTAERLPGRGPQRGVSGSWQGRAGKAGNWRRVRGKAAAWQAQIIYL